MTKEGHSAKLIYNSKSEEVTWVWTTKEAFAKLISKRGWYNDLGIGYAAGSSVAKRFKDGEKISTDKLEEILEKAGYKVLQEKLWEKPV